MVSSGDTKTSTKGKDVLKENQLSQQRVNRIILRKGSWI